MVIATEMLSNLNAEELRAMVQSLLQTVTFKQATIDKLTHENAILKRLKFAAQSERFSAEQRSLLEETLEEDLQAVSDEIEQLTSDDKPARVKEQPKRQPLPASLPRIDISHEPDSTTCTCGCQMKRIGIDDEFTPTANSKEPEKPANSYSYPQLPLKKSALVPGQNLIGTGGQDSIDANTQGHPHAISLVIKDCQ